VTDAQGVARRPSSRPSACVSPSGTRRCLSRVGGHRLHDLLADGASLAQRDREILDSKLGQYAAIYLRGGLLALTDTVQAEQRTAPERLFVRVVDRGEEAIVLSHPKAGISIGWRPPRSP